MGTLSRHKKTKLGMLPGDIGIRGKALMLEKGIHPQTGRPAKTFKKDVVRMANRRTRRAPIEE